MRIDRHARTKNGAPAMTTTGVHRIASMLSSIFSPNRFRNGRVPANASEIPIPKQWHAEDQAEPEQARHRTQFLIGRGIIGRQGAGHEVCARQRGQARG